MSNFEKEYYEHEHFWAGEMVQDAANKKRIELTCDLIPSGIKTLADVGCGNGVFLHYILQKRPEIEAIGVDRSQTALKFVKAKKIEASIENLPLENKSIDCVTCLEVIEHLPIDIYEKGLDELARITGKTLIISVPYNEILEDSYNKCPNCKSIFNRVFHLRNFTKQKMETLMSDRGFKCKETVTTGTARHFWGHKRYRQLFYPEQLLKWNSAICPICGFKEKGKTISQQNSHSSIQAIISKRKLISYFSAIPKMVWPKIAKDYWIIARYERES